ncbi:hypothetical protein RvY_13909 [Ramazzottius varieornatus]|uniref:Uncharacterized protein n=1 Tax=Ramazzottius varieornatus TaxID=947166 RepID=A0A1D1VTG1_RAMVA|nr:hypothetical protein RvY_13909 [Ramazzottius varieornatus]
MDKTQNKGKRKSDTQKKGKKAPTGCSAKLSGCNAGNNKIHLLKHPKLYKEYLELFEKQKAGKKEGPVSLRQVKLDQMAQSKKLYDKDHPK